MLVPFIACRSVSVLQIWQNAEKLGLYGKNTVPTSNYYIGAGDSGMILTGGTVGGMAISGLLQCHVLLHCSLHLHAEKLVQTCRAPLKWSHTCSE